jgi:threonine dehydratase
VIASSGASIKDIAHDRIFSGPDVSVVHAVCTVETRNRAHIATLQRVLKKSGFPLVSDRRRAGAS